MKGMFVIVFVLCMVNPCLADVRVVDIINITDTAGPMGEANPAWSPDGSKLAMAKGCDYTAGGQGLSIWVMDADGGNQTMLNSPVGYANLNLPDWSPDGEKIVFNYDRVGAGDIWVMDSDGANQVRLTNDSRKDRYPDWSPSGDEIAYKRGAHIWKMNADGSGQTAITSGSYFDGYPQWSPDGSTILFSRRDPAQPNVHIFTMNPDGADITQLTFGNENFFYPSWSSDGSRIVFVSNKGGNRDLWVMNSDGSDQMQLTDSGEVYCPKWSPVEDAVVFFHPVGGRCSDDIFMARLAINSPPTADAGPDQTVEQQNPDGARVVLDGSVSCDPDSTPGTNDDIASFHWYEDGDLLGGGEILESTLGPGEHVVTLVVADSRGEADEDEVVIHVQNATAPQVILIAVEKNSLWPPNHKMVDVGLSYIVSDNGDPNPVVATRVTSDEPTASAPGAGGSRHAPDAVIDGDDVLLRSERSGEYDGRVYEITINATDASGNNGSASIPVRVNHDKKTEAVDSGQNYDAAAIN